MNLLVAGADWCLLTSRWRGCVPLGRSVDKKDRMTERERESGLASTCCTPLSVSSPLCLLLIRCPHGTVLLDMVGMDHMAVGMDVNEAAGVKSRKYDPMSSGSARSATLETGGVVQIADTVRVS